MAKQSRPGIFARNARSVKALKLTPDEINLLLRAIQIGVEDGSLTGTSVEDDGGPIPELVEMAERLTERLRSALP